MSNDAVKYLLGQLPDDERDRLEREYFSHADDFEAMLATEDELFFDYVLERLAPADRISFEQRFLATAAGRQKLAFAGALLQSLRIHRDRTAAGSPATPHRPARWFGGRILQPALAAAVVALSVATVWLARDLGRARSEAAAARTARSMTPPADRDLRSTLEREQQRSAELERELADARRAAPPIAPPAPPLMIAVGLTPGLVRGAGESRRVAVPADAAGLRIALEADASLDGLQRAIVRTAEGTEVWSQRLAVRRGGPRPIVLEVPARAFGTNDYEVVLEPIGGGVPITYSFGVVR